MTESGKKSFLRTCYQCGKEIPDVSGKYFCSQECWDKYGENQNKKKPKNSRLTIKEIQERWKGKKNLTSEELMRRVGMI